MLRILISGFFLFAVCDPALAQPDEPPWTHEEWIAHVAITVLGCFIAVHLALQAFARPVQIANAPTFPKYMTSPQQYRLGSFIFIVFACSFFLLLVFLHRHVVAAASVFQPQLPQLGQTAFKAIQDQSPSYLLIVFTMGGLYLYLLTKEAEWNVLLKMRDTIHCWISIPGLAKNIVDRLQTALLVPRDAINAVVAAYPGSVSEKDFGKDRYTPDRQWAETCYMKWWLTPREQSGDDATFFNEESYGFKNVTREFKLTTLAMRACKSGDDAAPAPAEVSILVKELHEKFSRLIACYLIYRNASTEELHREARKFGIDMRARESGNPLQYWIVYAIVLMAAVYFGVYASAISYDWFVNGTINLSQEPKLALAWVMYSFANYGLAMIVILLIRFAGAVRPGGSHAITYCWTFAVALVTGPAGLTLAVHYFGIKDFQDMPIHELFFEMLIWGLGPALVCVYISYYLDRQTWGDLPDIESSFSTIGWRLLNCFGFSMITVFILLPPLLAMKAEPGAPWDSAKLRFVGIGTVFFIAFGLALAAQFALVKPRSPVANREVEPRIVGVVEHAA